MKWYLSIFFIILIIFSVFFYKSWRVFHQELNIHASPIYTDSPLINTAKTEFLFNYDHQKIAYWSFPVKKPKAVVILAHGYSSPGGKNQMLSHVDYLNQAGYSVYLPDLRSFGDSDGQKISLGIKEWQDLETIYDFAHSLPENKDLKIGYLGFSMGAVSAINSLALTGKGDFLIASVPYASVNSLYQFRLHQSNFFSFFFTRLAIITELGFDSQSLSPQALISQIHVPLLIFSAKNDTYVNSQDAKLLFDLANTTKEFWQADSNHDIFATLPLDFQQHVLTFLAKID